jgi:hypothetical protein
MFLLGSPNANAIICYQGSGRRHGKNNRSYGELQTLLLLGSLHKFTVEMIEPAKFIVSTHLELGLLGG